MAENQATPRVTSQYLDSFTGKIVRIVGKVTKLMGTQADIDSEGAVTLILNHDSHLTLGNAVEIVGKVNQDLTIKVLKATDFGNNFDYASNLLVVDITHRYESIFYPKPVGT